MEAGLRASVDRDLSSLVQSVRAERHLIQALAITQGEHTEILERHTQTLAQHGQALQAAHDKLDRIIALLGRLSGDEAGS
jgi:hypothetical protein